MIGHFIVRRARLTLLLVLIAAAIPVMTARSQDRTAQDRLDRLERDLSMLQRQVYRSGPTPIVAPNSGAAVDNELRMDRLEEQMQRLEQFMVYSDDSQRQIETVNLLVARNTPVTFAHPDSEIIQELEPEPLPDPKGKHETKTGVKETRPAAVEPEIRKAKAAATPMPIRKALPYSPGVQKFHSSPSPTPPHSGPAAFPPVPSGA